MKTVPLYGAKAAGRVVRVDDEDYGLVMQHRWHIHDPEPTPGTRGKRRKPPYAVTNYCIGGKRGSIRMHCLIMGAKGVDHVDHDGLNNQKSNLRVATNAENSRNQRPQLATSSQYKGVCRIGQRGLWRAYITFSGQRVNLGDFASELRAAYTYDAAARELFGEFACPNFGDLPTQAMREQWDREEQARSAVTFAVRERAHVEGSVRWWTQRQPETCVCVECGGEYQSRAVGTKMYCGDACRDAAMDRKRRERRREARRRVLEGRLF